MTPCLYGPVLKTLVLQDWLPSEGSQGLPQRDPHGILAQLLHTSGNVYFIPDWGGDQQTDNWGQNVHFCEPQFPHQESEGVGPEECQDSSFLKMP